MELPSTSSSFSTSKQKAAFLRTWYPNGVPIGDQVAKSMSLTRLQPKNFESLNTDSDISELVEYEHADFLPVSESAKVGIGVSSSTPPLAFHRGKSLATCENVALVSTSLTHSQGNDWEMITGTRLSLDMESMTLSDGKLLNQNVGTLWQQLMKERKDRQECLFLLEQLQDNYDVLLQKYARAENTIDILRIRREVQDGHVYPLTLDGAQMARIRYRDDEEGHSGYNMNGLPTSHRKAENRKRMMEGKYQCMIREQESKSGATHSSSARHSANTNPIQKSSIISIQLRANCLKDQINFTKMAMEEQIDGFSQNDDIIQELKDNLELLKHDYNVLKSCERDVCLEATIRQLQASLKELESSSVAVFPHSEQWTNESPLAKVSKESIKPEYPHSAFPQIERRVVWPPPPPLDDPINAPGAPDRERSSNGNDVHPTHKEKRSSKSSKKRPTINRAPLHPVNIPRNDQLANWSVSYFGKLNANICIDKKVQNVLPCEQHPNFSLGHGCTINEQELNSATTNNLHETGLNNLCENRRRNEPNVVNSSSRRQEGSNAPTSAPPPNDPNPACNRQGTSTRCGRQGGYQAGNVNIRLKESKINLQSKNDHITKSEILTTLQRAEKKAHKLHRKSSEILSRIYGPSDPKISPNVYY